MKISNLLPAILVVLVPASGAGAEAPVVDGRRALDKVRQLVAISPRDSGTENARKAAVWIAAQCRELGTKPEVDSWEEETANGKMSFHNVKAVVPGRRERRLILGSHFDTKRLPSIPGFQGANDSGSSTGLLLEIMRVIRASAEPPPFTLEFMFFDGEECVREYGPRDGLHGSRRRAKQLAEADEVDQYEGMILLDMVGDADLTVTLSPDTPPELGTVLLQAAAAQRVGEHFSFHRSRILDDHVPFAEIGIQAVNVIDFHYGPENSYWHTAGDTMDKLSAESLQTVGNVVLETIWRLAE
jgi:hypothetical protein